MSLHSFVFIFFVAGLVSVLGILQLMHRKWKLVSRIQLYLILIASYCFIATYDGVCCACIFLVTAWTYVFGRLIDFFRGDKSTSRNLMSGAITGLVLFLGFFKYVGFFSRSGDSIILPIGISFYVFTAISYVADVYMDRCIVEPDFLGFAMYLSFFPKIIAGPIVRVKDFMTQIKEYDGVHLNDLETGTQIFVFGLFKKMVLADHLGVFVNDVFRMPEAFNTGTVILAAISYSLQIYLDFSGYSDMAVGVSRMLGFDLAANFNLPYIAENVSDFWSRWHISLSSWLRDYVYIPLGGSRKGRVRTYLNLMVTMLISGLWHGVGWTFVIWGGLHGVLSCIHRFLTVRNKHEADIQQVTFDSLSMLQKNDRFNCVKIGQLYRLGNKLVTFLVVTLLWVIFRADSIDVAARIFKAMFTIHSGINQPYSWTFIALLSVLIATCVAWRRSNLSISASCEYKGIACDKELRINGFYPIMDLSKFWSLVLFSVICGLVVIMGYFGNTAFIYGKF